MRYLPVLLVVAVTVFCLVDCVQTPDSAVRGLPKPVWLLLILLLPPLGAVGWYLAGRPVGPPRFGGRGGSGGPGGPGGPRRGPQGPDDDPDFLRGIGSR